MDKHPLMQQMFSMAGSEYLNQWRLSDQLIKSCGNVHSPQRLIYLCFLINSCEPMNKHPPWPNPSVIEESKWMWSEVCLSDMNKPCPPRCHLLHHHSRGLPYLGQYCSRSCPPLGKTERMWGVPLQCCAGALTVFRWNLDKLYWSTE